MGNELQAAKMQILDLQLQLSQRVEAERSLADVNDLHAQISHLQLELQRVSAANCADAPVADRTSQFLPRYSTPQLEHEGLASAKPTSMQMCTYIQDPVAAKACELKYMSFAGGEAPLSDAVKTVALEAEAMAQQSESEAKQAALDLAAAEARLVDLLGAENADTVIQAAADQSMTISATEPAIPLEAAPQFGSIGTSGPARSGDDSDWAKAEKMAGCAQHSGCRDLEGLCCPTHMGLFLECCSTGAPAEQQPTQDPAPVAATDSALSDPTVRGWN